MQISRKSIIASFAFALLFAVGFGAGATRVSAAEAPAADLKVRMASHGFPSIFQAWSPMQNLNQAPATAIPLSETESPLQTIARHDLIFLDLSGIGLAWNNASNPGLSTGFTLASIEKARKFRVQLRALNPNAVLLAEIRYHDAKSGYIPDDSPWWLRDETGNRIAKTHGTALSGFFMLDPAQPGFQDQIATVCAAAVDTGVVDGCMLDWWEDTLSHVAIAQKIRAKIGDRGLILGNVNGRLPIRSAPYINGMFMEGFGASFFPDWRTAVVNLQWATSHLRPPAFTAFEAWYPNDAPVSGTTRRNDLTKMRMITTLSLCNCDGYVLYGDPSPTPGHPHDWYTFWQPTLGTATEAPGRINADGSYARTFQHGTAVFNPPGNLEVHVVFKTPVTRQSTQAVGTEFGVPAGDGEIFIAK
jgi:hypothetical protein